MAKNEPILTISIASELVGLHPRTLMLYEKAGLVFPHRTGSKRRLFSIKDLNRLQLIKFLSQKKGVNLQGIKFLLEAIEIGEEKGLNLRRRLFPTFKQKRLV